MNVTANHTIHAAFAINSYQIGATAGAGGTITPSGTVAAVYGSDMEFAIAPNAGYRLADLLVDNLHVDSTTSYTFNNVTANHTIAASFALLNHLPSAFTLAEPADGDSIQLYTNPKPVTFKWHPSSDADVADTLEYTLSFPGTSIEDTTVRDTTVTLDIMEALTPNTVYHWTVRVTDGHATVAATDTFTFRTSTIVLAVKEKKGRIPTEYALYQNYPNPFNPSTTIEFDLPQESKVTLAVYNLLGQEVERVYSGEEMQMGVQTVVFNEDGLTTGVYFYRIVAEGVNGKTFTSVRRMLLVK